MSLLIYEKGLLIYEKDLEMWTTSAKLLRTYNSLEELMTGKELTKRKEEDLKWTGDLIGRIDWNSQYYEKSPTEITLIATKLRPYFFEFRIKQIRENKLKTKEKQDNFTIETYELLHQQRTPTQMSEGYFAMAQNLIEYLKEQAEYKAGI